MVEVTKGIEETLRYSYLLNLQTNENIYLNVRYPN